MSTFIIPIVIIIILVTVLITKYIVENKLKKEFKLSLKQIAKLHSISEQICYIEGKDKAEKELYEYINLINEVTRKNVYKSQYDKICAMLEEEVDKRIAKEKANNLAEFTKDLKEENADNGEVKDEKLNEQP